MELQRRVKAFVQLGIKLQNLEEIQAEELVFRTRALNKWFDEKSIKYALEGIIYLLDEERLNAFAKKYDITNAPSKKIGVVMAGNIPAVGFHDYLCVLLTGNELYAKLSSQDKYLLQAIHQFLLEIEPNFAETTSFIEQLPLKELDAVIATGSDNSSRYFEQYFSKLPNIIRKNRTSCGVLTGEETAEDFVQLGQDIFQYYGLGCRNVSKVFVPKGYNFTPMLDALAVYEETAYHATYENNYTYNKSVYLVNKEKHLDTGFLLVRASDELVSPIGVLFYEEYEEKNVLTERIDLLEEKIQCIVSKDASWKNSEAFGQAQCPKIDDYADGVDTMEFLLTL